MLSQRYDEAIIRKALVSQEDWRPYPTVADRAFWNGLPEAVRQAHVGRGEAALGYEWPALPATLFLDFARTGNRRNYQQQSFARRTTLCHLVIAECMDGRGRFLDDIANGIWAICEESFWGIPACMYMQKAGVGLPDVDEPVVPLFVGETVNLLAWSVYLLGDQLADVSPLIVPRVLRESDRRVLTPCLERDDFWWMGFGNRRVNNWNPWVNSNWLAANLLMESDADRRVRAVAKILRSLDNFIDPYPKDGGCDEGPGYWGRAGASLFDCLALLYRATDGAIDVYDEPLIQDIGRYIYRAHIADRYFVNFADAPAQAVPSATIVFQYGQRIGDDDMLAFGAWCAGEQQVAERGLSDSIGRQLAGFQALPDLLATEAAQPLLRDVWFSEIQVMTARDAAGRSDGFFVAVKGGHNAESHNHNDVGNLVVYVDGRPVIVDAGVETYTAKTFSPQRYEIWTMQSAYHNVPIVNGVQQMPGAAFAARGVAYLADDARAELKLDLAGAYPDAASVRSWERTVALERGNGVRISDAFVLDAVNGPLKMVWMTPCDVSTSDAGCLRLVAMPLTDGRISGSACIRYDSEMFSITTEPIDLDDPQLQRVWGRFLHRVVLTLNDPAPTGRWTFQVTRS